MTNQRALRRILQLFKLLSSRLSHSLFYLVNLLLRLSPSLFTAKSSTARCNFSALPPRGPRVSSEGDQHGRVSSTIEPISPSQGENTSYIRPLQDSEPIPLNRDVDSGEGPSVSYPPTVPAVPAVTTTERRASSLTFAPEGSQRIPNRLPKPFGATDIDRYTGKPLIKPTNKDLPIIQAGKRVYDDSKDPSVTTSWTSCTHPEGALYFSDSHRKIFTDEDVRNIKNMDAIEKCVVQLANLAASLDITFPDSSLELVLKLVSEKDPHTKKKQFHYYFVDVNKKLLFWLSNCAPMGVFQGLKGVNEPMHIKKALEMQYWKHCELYPCNRTFDIGVLNELRGLIIHANAESITSDTFLAPFEPAELSKMMDILDIVKEAVGKIDDHLVAVVAKFMGMFMHVQFLSFHGQPEARLDTDQSIYESSGHRARTSILLHIINPVFFGTPSTYSEEIKRVWVDELVNLPRWRTFITTRTTEWTGFTIYSTVMLAVDVSLLAVPGVDPATEAVQPVSVIAIYISVLCIIGSLFSSVILINQSRESARSSSDKVSQYMMKMTSSFLGTDILAIMYSVPLGLLVWGMILFLVGFVFVVFNSKYTATLATTGPVILVITIFAAWPVWASIDKVLKWMQVMRTISIGKSVRGRQERTRQTSRRQILPSSAEPSRGHDESLSASMA